MPHHTSPSRRKPPDSRAVPGRMRSGRICAGRASPPHHAEGDTEDETASGSTPGAFSSRLTRLRILVWWYLVRFDTEHLPTSVGTGPLATLIRESRVDGFDRSEPQACDWDQALARYVSSVSDVPTRGRQGRGIGARRRLRHDHPMPPKAGLTARLLAAIEQDIRLLEQLAARDDTKGCHHW